MINIKLIVYSIPILVLLGISGKLWFDNSSLQEERSSLLSKIDDKDLELGRVRAHSSDMEIELKSLEDELANEIKRRDEKLVTVVRATGEHNVTGGKEGNTDTFTDNTVVDDPLSSIPKNTEVTCLDPRGKKLNSFGIEFRDFRVDIRADVLQRSVLYKLHQKFVLTVLRTVDKDNQEEVYVQLNEVTPKGLVRIKLSDVTASTLREELGAAWYWLAPHLDLGLAFDPLNLNLSPNLGLSISGYGKSENELSWRLGHIGAGLDNEEPYGTFTPIKYNLGDLIPIISNTWLGIGVKYTPSTQKVSGEVNLSVVL